MKVNPVVYCTFIIRSQIEYSAIAQAAIVRCILETPATSQQRGYTDVEDLLTVLRAELTDMQNRIVPPVQTKENR
ncbi:hypothetical protein [Caldilinea sp.]|uniref:hypothetical protein n=1 Tax=Caldilinea sp. TaxID=2293560 RepID=UPI002CACF401|nr:hypothetical protein [Anaerolineales bacterium]HQY94701.1 hypothetical protein [Caldilinea sp.]